MLEHSAVEAFNYYGIHAYPVCHCEWEAVTAALLSRLQDATNNPAPIWDDITTFDGRPWRGIVDCVTAGLPCPAYSCSGKRLGNDDDRAWGPAGESGPQFHFLRIVTEIIPGIIFLENVPEFVSGGHFRRLGDSLLRLGYRIPPAVYIPASAVGATQQRERVFIMAYREDSHGWSQFQSRQSPIYGRSRPSGIGSELGQCQSRRFRTHGRAQGEPGHPTESKQPMGCAQRSDRRQDMPMQRPDGRIATRRASEGVGDSNSARLGTSGKFKTPNADTRCQAMGHFPPGRGHYTDPQWQHIIHLDPAVLPAVEPGFSMVVDGLAVSASDLLRIGGNGVVPLAAATAFIHLLNHVYKGR